MNIQPVQSQKGFLSAFVIIFTVTLGLLAVGSAVLVRSESTNIGNQAAMITAENAARSAVHYARRFIAVHGDSLEMQVPPIGGATVSMYQIPSGSLIDLYITVNSGPVENHLKVELQGAGSLNYAIYASGTVSDQDTDDSTGTEDNSLIYQNAPMFPTVDVEALQAIADAEGLTRTITVVTFSPGDGWPDASRRDFFNASGLPEVTIVQGNLNVVKNRTIYGIYVVSGTVTLEGTTSGNGGWLDGIIYMDTPNMLCTLGGRSRVRGAIYTRGPVEGTAGGWFTVASVVRHTPTWVRAFLNYVDAGTETPVPSVLSWEYY